MQRSHLRGGSSGGAPNQAGSSRDDAQELRALETALAYAQTRVEILESALGVKKSLRHIDGGHGSLQHELQQEKEASSQVTLCRISAPKHAMARFDGLEDDRVEEDAHQILRYAKSRGQDQVVDRFGAAEIEKFLLTYKYQHRAQEAACRVQTWWRMRVRRVKFLRVQRRRRAIRAKFLRGWVFFVKAESVLRRFVRRRFIYRWRTAKDEGVAARKLIMQMTKGHNDVLMSKLLVRMERRKISMARSTMASSASSPQSKAAAITGKTAQPNQMQDSNRVKEVSTQLFMDPRQRRAALEKEEQERMWVRVRQMAERNQKRQAVLGWKVFMKLTALRRIQAGMHLLRMKRLSKRRRDVKLWVGERRQIIFEMWRRWSAFRRSRRMNEPTPVYEMDFPLWDEWLENFARMSLLKAHAAARAPRMLLLRFFRKLCSFRKRRQKKRDNEALAKQQYEESRQYYVLKHWFAHARQRGSLLRQTRRVLVTWYEWTKRKVRLRVVKRFLALNMRSDTKRVVLQKWKQRYEDAESLRMIRNDAILASGSVRSVQVALHAVFMWKQDAAHVYFVRAWWAWRRVCEGRRRWTYARFVYLRAEARRLQRIAFAAWANWLYNRRGRHGKIAKTAPHRFTTAQQLRDCLEAGSALPSQWRVEDTSDISTLSTWMTRTRDPALAPRHDTPLHEAVDLGDLEAVRRILGTFENPAKARKMHALEKHKLRMFKQVRKAREANKKADSPLAKAKRTPEKEDPAEGETPVDVASELRAMDALGDFAVDTRNEQGLSCLHLAARHAGDTRFEIVVLLVRAGASVFAKDDEGRMPVDLATDPRTRAFLGLHAGRLEAHEFTPLEFHSYRRIRMHSTWSHLSSAGFWRVAISASCSSDASLLVRSMPRSPTYASGVLLAMGGFEGQELLRKAQQRTVEARTLAMRRILERDKVILARAVVRQQLAEAEAEAKANAANGRKGAKGKGGLRGKRRSRAVKPSAYFLHYLETTEIPHAGKINELVFREPSKRSGSAAESKARDSGSGSSRRDAAPLAAMNIFQKVLGPKPSCAWALRSAVPNRRAGASTMRAFTANLPPCSEVLRAFEDSYGGMPGDREHLAASQFEANLIAGSTISSLEGRESPDDGALGRLSAAWKLAIEVREDYLERLGDACSYLNVRKHEYLQRVADAEATIKSMDTKARSCRRSRRLTAQELKGDHERIQTELAELEAEMGITRSKMTRFQERIGQLLTELANLRGRGQANTARARALKKELVEQQEQAQQVQTQINSEERQKARLVNATDETFNESIRRLNELESLQTEAKSVATELREQVSSNRDKASCFKQFEEKLKSLWIGARTKLDEARFKQHSPGLEFEQPPSFLENIMLDYEVIKTSNLNPLLNDHAGLQAVHEDEVTNTLTENETVLSPKTSSGPNLGLPSEEKSVALEEPSARPSSPAASSRPNSREDSVSRRDSAASTVTGSGSEIEEVGMVDDESDGDDSSEAASLAIDEHGGSSSEDENLDDDDDDAEDEEASDDEAKGDREVDVHRNGLDSSEDTPQSWNDTGFRSFSAKDVGPRPSRVDVLMVQTYTKRSTPLDQDPILQLASPLSREHPTGRKVVARVRADEMPRTSEFARRSSVVVVRDKEHVVDRSMSMRRLDTLFTESRRLLFDGEVVDEEIKIGKAMEKERAERAKELADREKFEREAQEHLARTGNGGQSQLEGGLEHSRADRMSILLNKNRDSIELRVKQLTPRAQQPSEDDDENAILWDEATKMKQFPELERPDFFFANFVTTSEQDTQNNDQAAKTQQGHSSLDDDANGLNEADAPSACDAEDGVDSLSQDGEIMNDGETSPSPSQTSSNDEEKEDDEDEAYFAARMAAALKQVVPRGVAPFPAALWKSQGNAVSSKQQRALNKAQGMSFEREKLDPFLKMARRNEDTLWKDAPTSGLEDSQSVQQKQKQQEQEQEQEKCRKMEEEQARLYKENSKMGALTSVSFIPRSPTRATPPSPEEASLSVLGDATTSKPTLDNVSAGALSKRDGSEEHSAKPGNSVDVQADNADQSHRTTCKGDLDGEHINVKEKESEREGREAVAISEVGDSRSEAFASRESSEFIEPAPPGADCEEADLSPIDGAADFFDQVDELLLAAEGCDIEDPGNKMVQGKETEIAVEKSVKLRPVSQVEAARILREERAALKTAQAERQNCLDLRKQHNLGPRSLSQGRLRDITYGRRFLPSAQEETSGDGTAIEVRSAQIRVADMRMSKSAASYRPRGIAEDLAKHIEHREQEQSTTKRCVSAAVLETCNLDNVLQAHAVVDSDTRHLPPRHDFATARRQGVRRARRARLEPLQRSSAKPSAPALLFVGRTISHAQAIE